MLTFFSALIFATTCVANYNGAPAVLVDGSPITPMSMLVMADWHPKPDPEQRAYYRRLSEAGVRTFYVTCSLRQGVDNAVARVRNLLDSIPNARIMLRLNVSPPAKWVEAHPEEMVTYNDGSHQRTVCDTIGDESISGMLSLCSEAWRAWGETEIVRFIAELKKSDVAKSVIGVLLCAGGTSEWYYPIGMTTQDGRYADFSKPFQSKYARFLKNKYGRAMEPRIPTPDERRFALKSDSDIRQMLHTWESGERASGQKSSARFHLGVFLNMNTCSHVKDFYDAWHEGTANTIIHFASAVKKASPGWLTGAFYGSMGCTGYFHLGTATGTLKILDSGVVDFLAAPGVYNNREPGGIVAQREAQDSFRLRNCVFVCEEDSRTHLCTPWMQRDAMALYSPEDSVNTLKRDFGRNLSEGLYGWWFDMGNGWYDDPAILSLFRSQQTIMKEAFALNRAKKNEIAIIYDADSMHVVSDETSRLVLDFWRTSDLGRIGASVDYYFHDDMTKTNMPDYKLYVMANVYCLTDDECTAVYRKAARNNATVLWMYAPGFIDEKASGERSVMAVANISRTTGMVVEMIDHTFFPHFKVEGSTKRYGVIDQDVHSNIWLDRPLVFAPYVNPGFRIVDPSVTVLGRYCSDGSAALAEKIVDGVKSVYCTAPVVQFDLLAKIAAKAGCHIFSWGGDVLYSDENYVSLHAKDDGRRQIRLKGKCSPYEVYEHKSYGRDADVIEVDMKKGETKTWRLTSVN